MDSATLRAKRKYALIGIFIAAAVLTPPDLISQVSLALPVLLLYELSILSVRLAEKRQREAAPEASRRLTLVVALVVDGRPVLPL